MWRQSCIEGHAAEAPICVLQAGRAYRLRVIAINQVRQLSWCELARAEHNVPQQF